MVEKHSSFLLVVKTELQLMSQWIWEITVEDNPVHFWEVGGFMIEKREVMLKCPSPTPQCICFDCWCKNSSYSKLSSASSSVKEGCKFQVLLWVNLLREEEMET